MREGWEKNLEWRHAQKGFSHEWNPFLKKLPLTLDDFLMINGFPNDILVLLFISIHPLFFASSLSPSILFYHLSFTSSPHAYTTTHNVSVREKILHKTHFIVSTSVKFKPFIIAVLMLYWEMLWCSLRRQKMNFARWSVELPANLLMKKFYVLHKFAYFWKINLRLL